MDWTDDVITRLKALWADGHSTAEIGRRIGVSKNAVVGKAHRLALDARPSPIRRAPPDAEPKRPVAKRVSGPTLPVLQAAADDAAAAAPKVSMTAAPAAPPPQAAPRLPPAPPPAAAPAPVLRAVGRSGGGRLMPCCWPIGEPGTRSFRFCDEGSLPGKPYCAAHAALAYVKVRDRREDAA